MADLRVFIGWDSREDIAYQVAKRSLLRHASIDVEVTPIKVQELVDQGAYTREIDPLASTEFTYSRFLTPYLAGFLGWALFIDCDFLYLRDIAPLLERFAHWDGRRYRSRSRGRWLGPVRSAGEARHRAPPRGPWSTPRSTSLR